MNFDQLKNGRILVLRNSNKNTLLKFAVDTCYLKIDYAFKFLQDKSIEWERLPIFLYLTRNNKFSYNS